MKLCVVCSHGGHLVEMLQLTKAFNGYQAFLVTHYDMFTSNLKGGNFVKKYLLPVKFKLSRLLMDMLIETIEEFKILMKEDPDIIVSTGSEIAIPICYMGKILRKKIIFIESLCRIHDLSLTGKIIYPIADLFLVQWESLSKKYKKARYEGRVI